MFIRVIAGELCRADPSRKNVMEIRAVLQLRPQLVFLSYLTKKSLTYLCSLIRRKKARMKVQTVAQERTHWGVYILGTPKFNCPETKMGQEDATYGINKQENK